MGGCVSKTEEKKTIFVEEAPEPAGPMKIKKLEAHFNPSAVGGNKPNFHEEIEAWVEKYTKAYENHEVHTLFAKEGDVSWTDPVGTDTHFGHTAIQVT